MFTFKKEAEQIYSLCFNDPYKLAMTFLRCQEYYESENPRFYRKKFTIVQYMDWYFQKFGSFEYHKHWAGFNFPSVIVDEVDRLGIDDLNHYDLLLKSICEMAKSDANNDRVYLIGYKKGNKATLRHEISHGRFHLNGEYRVKIENLFAKLPVELQNRLYKAMVDTGYNQSSCVDEFQAYANENCEKRFWTEEITPELQEFFDNIRKTYKEFYP